MLSYKIESFTQNYSQYSMQPELRFAFEMRASEGRENAYFNNKRIVFIVKNGIIQKAVLLDLSSHRYGYSLKRIEKADDVQSVVLEDDHGMIRMLLKENETGLSEISINHPLNSYSLVSTTEN